MEVTDGKLHYIKGSYQLWQIQIKYKIYNK